MDDFIDTKNQVEKVLSEIKDGNVNLENYKNFVNKLKSAEGIIETQIGTLQNRYNEQKKDLADHENGERYKSAIKQGFVPKESVDFHRRMRETMSDAYSWKTLEIQLFSLLFNKMKDILEDVNALDIKKGVLAETREMETKRNQLFLDTVKRTSQMTEDVINHKLSVFDDKVISGIKSMVKEMIEDRKAMLLAFAEIMSESSREKKDFLDMIKEMKREEPTDEYEKIKKPVEKVGKTKIDKKEKKRGDSVVNQDPFSAPSIADVDGDDEDDIEDIDDEDDVIKDDGGFQ